MLNDCQTNYFCALFFNILRGFLSPLSQSGTTKSAICAQAHIASRRSFACSPSGSSKPPLFGNPSGNVVRKCRHASRLAPAADLRPDLYMESKVKGFSGYASMSPQLVPANANLRRPALHRPGAEHPGVLNLVT